MNPHWIGKIARDMQKATRTCPHCGRRGVYPPKEPGHFHTCKHCGHRFQEKKETHNNV